jgi:hypothetical protein
VDDSRQTLRMCGAGCADHWASGAPSVTEDLCHLSCVISISNTACCGGASCTHRATPSAQNQDWVLATCQYGDPFVAAVGKGNTYACQVGR